jgi:uncharacterized membrane protein YeaQ/YmgE (transglycosylase-associated protein family)
MWLIIGALAGWIGSKIMGTDERQGAVANIVVGIVGALLGGFVTRALFGDDRSNNGFIASLAIALLGSIVVIAIWRAVSRRVRT